MIEMRSVKDAIERIKSSGYDVKISQKKPYLYLIEIYEDNLCLFSKVLRKKDLSNLILLIDYLLGKKEDKGYG